MGFGAYGKHGFGRSVLGFALVLFLASGSLQASAWKKAAALDIDKSEANSVMVSVTKQSTASIVLDYTVPAPGFTPIPLQKFALGTPVRCDMGNARLLSTPGKPLVPYVYSRVIIPYGYTVAGVRLIPSKTMALPGNYLLAYGEKPTPTSRPVPYVTEPDLAVYGSDGAYPGKTAELAGIQYRCGVRVAEIRIFPLSYRPKSGTIAYCPSFSLEVTLKRAATPGTDLPAYPQRLLEGIVTEENTEALATYPVHKAASGQTYKWLAITSRAIINATTTPNINDLVALRTSQGLTCKVVAVEDVLASSQGTDNVYKIRNYIKSAYTNWGTKYVLLGGDINIIPVDSIQFAGQGIPTDIFYSCIDQAVWSKDYSGEVFVGRISADSASAFANQVYKIIKYETDPDSCKYLTTGLSVGEKMDDNPTFSVAAMDSIAKFFPSPTYTFDRYSSTTSWEITGDSTIKLINSNKYSVWNNLGHGNLDYAWSLFNGDEKKMKNTNFPLVYSEACLWGGYDTMCLAECITVNTRTGFFAAVANSREGFYAGRNAMEGDSWFVHRSFWQACFSQGLNCFGEFNEYTKRIWGNEYYQVTLESTLFCDPAARMRGKGSLPFVRVLMPNGGEKWGQRGTYNIAWDAKNVAGDIKIELLRGTTPTVLAAAVPCSTKTWAWTVAATQTVATNYTVRLSSVTTPSLTDASDATFSIATTGVAPDNSSLPAVFDLRAKGSKILFQVPADGAAGRQALSIVTYALDGKAIRTLAAGTYPAGRYSIDLGAAALPSGMHLCKITSAKFTKTVPILSTK